MSARERHSDNPAFLLFKALVTGQKIFYATSDGNVNKKTIVCSDLTAVSDQDGNQVHIVDPNSAANGQTRDITGATTAGTVNVGTAFDTKITEDTAFILTGIRSTPIEVAAFESWVKTAIGDASGHTLTSLVTKWGDITRSLDLVLGARWDAAGDLGTDVANIITAIAAIQNNTRFTAAVPVQMCLPDAGNEAFRMASNLYDTEGNMEDPTNDEILVRVIKDDGTYITADLYKENGLANGLDNPTDGVTFPVASGWRAMEREAAGKFYLFFKTAHDATEESLTVEFGWTEDSKHNYQSRSTEIADVHGDLAEIIADIAALNDLSAANVWETNISAYAGAGYAGTYLKTLYDDWLNDGRLDVILDNIETQTEELVAGKLQIAATTEDLNQAADTYDLFTGTAQDVLMESLLIRTPNIVAGGAITSISIQTDDATPQVLLSAADGAVANLTAEAQLAWQNFDAPILIKTGKKIQLTINGGAHGVAYVCDIVAKVRAVTGGGYLA